LILEKNIVYIVKHSIQQPLIKFLSNFENPKVMDNNPLNLKLSNITNDEKTTNEWIFGKPAGTVFKKKIKDKLYITMVIQDSDKKKHSKTFSFNETNEKEIFDKAKKLQLEMSSNLGLTRNRIKIIDDNTIKVELTQGQIMTTNYKFLDLIQNNNLFAAKTKYDDNKYYAMIEINKKMHYFQTFIMNKEKVKHLDGDLLNNKLENLN